MTQEKGSYSVSGVRIADDYRDNLIVDRYDQCFVPMRQSKKTHLRSENSEDAISWNVFRSLNQIAPEKWVALLSNMAFGSDLLGNVNDTTVSLWRNIPPPPALLESGDEGVSEIDILLENPAWVWFIEAKYKSDISEGTTSRPTRDQILRNVDVGSYYAGVRPFYFALVYLDERRSPKGIEAVNKYRRTESLKAALPHRVDELTNLKGIGLLRWKDLAEILALTLEAEKNPDERVFAQRALQWLHIKGIHGE